jgi:hypothetical protein
MSRSDAYIKIVDSKFSHGNSTVSINEITKFLMFTQGPVLSDPTAAFSNRLSEHVAEKRVRYTVCGGGGIVENVGLW